MVDRVKLLLGPAAGSYTDAEIAAALEEAEAMVAGYTARTVAGDPVLTSCTVRAAVVMLNRRNTEGLSSTGAGGVSESYIDGLPADILAVLKNKRRAVLV